MSSDFGGSWANRAKFYDLEVAPDPDETAFWLEAFPADARSVLLVPSGSGQLAAVLASPGRRLTLIDREPAMVTLSAQHAKRLGPGNEARRGDMSKLGLNRRFDAIVVPGGALQLVADTESVLAELHAHLAPAGRLFVELVRFAPDVEGAPLSFYDPRATDGVWLDEWDRPVAEDSDRGASLRRRRQQFHDDDGLTVTFAFELIAAGGAVTDAWSSTVRLKRISDQAFEALLERRGLSIVSEFSDYRRSPGGPGRLRRLLTLEKLCKT